MRDVYVIGVAQTPFGKFLERSIKSLTREAVLGALKDEQVECKQTGILLSGKPKIQGRQE